MLKKLNIIFYLSFLYTPAQDLPPEDALVFFTDKENVEAAVNNPASILSQASIDRRKLHHIPIDQRDVPVNEAYIFKVKNRPGITVLSKSKWMNCIFVRGEKDRIDDLLDLPFVTAIEYADKSVHKTSAGSVPDKFAVENTPFKNLEYGPANVQIELLNGHRLHEQGYTGQGMVIAVLDSGFPGVDTLDGFAYVRENGRILGGYDFVDRKEIFENAHVHGTRVLSTIAGYVEGQYAGTAIDASYYLFRTEDATSETPVEEAYWVEALERADSLGVHIVNTSLGYRAYDDPNYSHTYEDLDGQTTFSARGGNIAFEKGMLLVTSAGNSANTDFPHVGTPADAPGVFTIGAVDGNGEYAPFSSTGPTADGRRKPDIMARGHQAAIINEHDEITSGNGTSYSSPIIAGLMACLWQARPEATNWELMQLVRKSAHLYEQPSDEMGYGIPDFGLALEALLTEKGPCRNSLLVYPNPATDKLYVVFTGAGGVATLMLYGLHGKIILTKELSVVNNSIDLSYLPVGIYAVYLESSTCRQGIKVVKGNRQP